MNLKDYRISAEELWNIFPLP
ncbi:hypothetical protein NTG1052_80006 [Candidatus Nitrotoga sp. 1052]|nr:hypothetical protein NTG1052_80006 [Candidatus Nitrotoga sp. 1052]